MLANAIILALGAIRRNMLRSFLTILGIVIGVASVIIMVTLGSGATAQVASQISAMGSNILMVTRGRRMGPGMGNVSAPFKMKDVEAIAAEIPAAAAVAPVSSRSATAVYGNENWSTTATGTTNDYFNATNRVVAAGRIFLDSEIRSGAAVCVIGSTVRKNLFGGMDPVGSRIRLGKISFEVVGLLTSKGQSGMGMDQDDVVVIPMRTLERRMSGNRDIGMIMVSVRDGVSTTQVQQAVETILRERRNIAGSKDDDFMVMDMKEITNTLTSTTKILTALLGAVAAVSLLVGGIGIMNIMLVSVTERTREIGTRLAIGALEREVLLQFLVESVVLSSLGGFFGIAIALGASVWLAKLLQVPFIFNGSIVLLAAFFSAAVGVVFGYFPALKAARFDPIEALRYE